MARIIQTENGQLRKQFIIIADQFTIGRGKTNQAQINEKFISLKHAQIFIEQDHKGNNIYFLMDLNSKNGSYINRDRVSCKQLKNKDQLRFGKQLFTFIDDL